MEQSKDIYLRFIHLFHDSDDNDLDKFQLEQINSDENIIYEHDETIQRFQKLADELSSPTISNIDCSMNSTPPIRRHHQRLLQHNDDEPLSRTPITPVHHTDLPRGKFLHSTINGSYAGPMTRNRTRTGGKPSILKSPGTNKTPVDLPFVISKYNDNN
ncbi:unnamed protein product [Rotaria magnacalcarata]|nr:unnamed protein product [Rotaria magnacalcarata]CAF1631468.1 unnamed protein product [Rotaria magnacalcarata]CAF2044867.1 unnamed protein product [Rotaria magnacalcarata]CAF2046950.1 unnamed protein product [Rotaria magnacalcarata]CAF2134335.1 unnamed protein product [Rotaria magnacalcarata]